MVVLLSSSIAAVTVVSTTIGDKDGCYQDIVYLRLADTYLLYAEALLKNNQAGEVPRNPICG